MSVTPHGHFVPESESLLAEVLELVLFYAIHHILKLGTIHCHVMVILPEKNQKEVLALYGLLQCNGPKNFRVPSYI